jgi:hypothetical protein
VAFPFSCLLGLVKRVAVLYFCSQTESILFSYKRPHSRKWICRRISEIAFNTTSEHHLTEGFPRGIRLHTPNLIRVCRTRIVSINLLCRRALVEANEALKEILAGRIVVSTASVVGEVVA